MIRLKQERFSFAEGLGDQMRFALRMAKSPLLRTPTEFAEQFVVVPEGKHEGEPYRVANQPFSRLVLQEFERDGINRFAGLGCVQSGKSYLYFALPVVYFTAERRDAVGIAAPTIEMGKKKWKKEILPIFNKSPKLANLLPKRGRGSQGGVPDLIELTNGATVEFFGAGAGDEQRSSSTIRVMVITEVDKMDEASELSRESDPIKQFEDRTAHFADGGVVILECTVSIPDGRIWQEHQRGSGGELVFPCPHCQEYVRPEKEHFVGFKTDNVIDARKESQFLCPACGAGFSDDDREEMQNQVQILHRGQTIDKDGTIHGDFPRTLTSSVRWSAFANRFWPNAFIAKWEWEAYKSIRDDAPDAPDYEARQAQKMFAVPYEGEDYSDFQLDPKVIRRRFGPEHLTEGIVPDNLEETTDASTFYDKELPILTMGVDIGKTTCHWVLLAFLADKTIHMPAYGAFTADSDLDTALEIALRDSLEVFHDEVIVPGFPIHGRDETIQPLAIWIDAGYQTDVVYRFCREKNNEYGDSVKDGRFRPSFGRGKSQAQFSGNLLPYSQPKEKDKTTRELGDNWFCRVNRQERCRYAVFNADYWKIWVQKRLVTKPGEPGAMSFYRSMRQTGASRDIHTRLVYQLTNERLEPVEKKGRGIVNEWVKRGQNHKLDATAMAAAAGSRAGFRLV